LGARAAGGQEKILGSWKEKKFATKNANAKLRRGQDYQGKWERHTERAGKMKNVGLGEKKKRTEEGRVGGGSRLDARRS